MELSKAKVPLDMEKEKITKDDGRYLIYYRFGSKGAGNIGTEQPDEGNCPPGEDCRGKTTSNCHGQSQRKGCGNCQS